MAPKSNAETNDETNDENDEHEEDENDEGHSGSSDDGTSGSSLRDYVRNVVEEAMGERTTARPRTLDTQRRRESSIAELVRKEQQKIEDESAAKAKSEETERRINALEIANNPPKISGVKGWLSKHFWGNP